MRHFLYFKEYFYSKKKDLIDEEMEQTYKEKQDGSRIKAPGKNPVIYVHGKIIETKKVIHP